MKLVICGWCIVVLVSVQTLFKCLAITFSTVTLFTGIVPLYGSSLMYAGPVGVVWGWVVVTFFTWFVGFAMAEICSSFPVSFLHNFSALIQLLCCYHCHPLDNCILSASSNIRLLCGVCCFFHPFHVYVRVSNYGSETSSPLLPSVIGQWFSYDLCLCRNYPGSIELLLSMSSC